MKTLSMALITLLIAGCKTEPRRLKRDAGSKLLPAYALSWPVTCAKLKKRLAGPGASLRAVPLPPRINEQDPWALSIGPMSASLPEHPYTIKVERNGKALTVALINPKQVVLLFKDPPSEPMRDIFAKVGGPPPTEEEQQRTFKIFGKHPTTWDLVKMGYAHTPSELTCKAENATKEMPIGISLVLKSTGHWAERVFSHTGFPDMVAFGQRGKRCHVEVRSHDKDGEYVVAYATPDREKCKAQVLRFRIKKGGQGAGPPWLAALGRAIRKPDERERWKAVHAELVKAKATPASLASVLKLTK